MPTIRIPNGSITGPPRAFTLDLLENALEETCPPGLDFSGFISVESGECLYLLFIFQSRPYAAGKAIGDKPAPMAIRDFFHETGLLADTAATISVHAGDPVLLKSLLIFLQCDPAAKAPASLINLEAVLNQIRQDAADALVILENRRMLNLFFFKDGNRGMSYFADTEFHDADGMPFDEQMLVYAFQSEAQVNALIYRTTATKEAEDALLVSREEMIGLLRGGHAATPHNSEDIPVLENEISEGSLELEILNGPMQGQVLNGPIPCVLGRKDADILIHDPQVSKRHAAVQVVNGKLMLVDLNSTNGTTLNGMNIVQHDVSEGDIIGIGATALKILRLAPP